MSIRAALANRIIRTACRPSAARFRAEAGRVAETQQAKLMAIITANAGSRFGRDHGFDRIDGYKAFRARVPVSDYACYKDYITALKRGEQNQLTAEPVRLLEPTGGGSSGSKLIPYTSGLQREFMAGVKPWLADLYVRYPRIAGGSSYWSISPLVDGVAQSTSAIPIGFEDDADYFGPLSGVLQSIYPVPKQVRLVRESDNFRYITTLLLLAAANLRLISVWSPSFLTILMGYIEREGDRLIASLRRGEVHWPVEEEGVPPVALRADRKRAGEVARILKRGATGFGYELWPELALISCWTDASAARQVQPLQDYFPAIPLQGKGLLATEGIISIPLGGRTVLAYQSHFFEFLDDNEKPRLAHELREGTNYSPLLSTAGGLYRYRLGDRVWVEGFSRSVPILRFLGREQCLDLVGEKLTDAFVSRVLEDLFGSPAAGRYGEFALLAPLNSLEASGRSGYALFYQGPEAAPGLRTRMETLLEENFHYAYARRLGQLDPVRLVRIKDGAVQRFLDFQIRKGRRAGDVKLPSLYLETDLEDCFAAEAHCAHYPY